MMARITVFVFLYFSITAADADEPPSGEQIVGALASTGRMVSESVDRLSAVVGGCGAADADARQLQSEVSSLKGEIADMKRHLSLSSSSTPSRVPKSINLDDSAVTTTVFFNAHSSKSTSCYDCPIPYGGVYADSHAALDIETGKFKAPVSGHYMFQFHGLTDSGNEVKIHFMVNGDAKLSIYDRDIKGYNSRYSMISQSMIHNLAEGDEVWAHLHRGGLKGGSTTFTSFLGIRLGQGNHKTRKEAVNDEENELL